MTKGPGLHRALQLKRFRNRQIEIARAERQSRIAGLREADDNPPYGIVTSDHHCPLSECGALKLRECIDNNHVGICPVDGRVVAYRHGCSIHIFFSKGSLLKRWPRSFSKVIEARRTTGLLSPDMRQSPELALDVFNWATENGYQSVIDNSDIKTVLAENDMLPQDHEAATAVVVHSDQHVEAGDISNSANTEVALKNTGQLPLVPPVTQLIANIRSTMKSYHPTKRAALRAIQAHRSVDVPQLGWQSGKKGANHESPELDRKAAKKLDKVARKAALDNLMTVTGGGNDTIALIPDV